MKNVILLFCVLNVSLINAQFTYVPDDEFEQLLIDLGYDSPPLNDYVLTASIDTITKLTVGIGFNINDLTGIEDFVVLERLVLSFNGLTSLDLSNNVNLNYFYTQGNEIDTLDFSSNQNISHFVVSGNPKLECILVDEENYNKNNFPNSHHSYSTNCDFNFTQIRDLSFENRLKNLGIETYPYINGQILTSLIDTIEVLDVTGTGFGIYSLVGIEDFASLKDLRCSHNQIDSLDLSFNHHLEVLLCSDNKLKFLNVKNGNNSNMFYYSSINNPLLECVTVDNINYSNNVWTLIDPQTSFSNGCGFLGNDEKNKMRPKTKIFSEKTYIYLDLEGIFNYKIYDLSGKILKFENDTDLNKIWVGDFQTGVYIVSIELPNQVILKKILITNE